MNDTPLPRHERGAATLIVMLGLLAALALGTLFANRGLLLEARMSANQARATVAFEAAEAGLDWTLAQLDTPARIGADCRPGAGTTGSFRERMLVDLPAGPAARVAAGGAPMRAACVRRAGAWACHCPTDGAIVLPASDDADPAAFVVEITAGERPGIVRVASAGSVSGRVGARTAAAFALLPALGAAPAAAVTARGTIDAGTATIANEDPSTAGLVLHAGGTIAATAAQLTTTAGSSSDGTLAANDAPLAASDAERRFVATFGQPRDVWKHRPGVAAIDCNAAADCAARVAAAVEAGHTMVAVDGELALGGPLTLGTSERPVLLAVRGRLLLDGPVLLHGLAFADGVAWQGAAGGAIRGALLSSADVTLSSAAAIRRDPAVLTALQRLTGTFVRVPGSWRDF